jgi:hypothetical protein
VKVAVAELAVQETSSKILDRPSTLNSAEEIASVVATYAGQRVLSILLPWALVWWKGCITQSTEKRNVRAIAVFLPAS